MERPPILSIADPWTHPRIPRPAQLADHYTYLREEAHGSLQRRKDGYPALIAKGKMSADEAHDDICAWQAIADDWDWIIGGEGKPANEVSLPARIEALDTAIARFFERLDRSGHEMTDGEDLQIQCLAAMRWHAERETSRDPTDNARFWASLGHRYRAENGMPTAAQYHRTQQNDERNAA